jgi:hypothetical protein
MKEVYTSIFYESQSLKALSNSNYIAQIKEELIGIDPHNQQITNYCVIVERA